MNKMKRKLIPVRIIKKCADCPGLYMGYCTFIGPQMNIDMYMKDLFKKGITFPDWCPLEDCE